MEEEVTRLVENTFANHDIEEIKKIIIDRILHYEEQLVNSVSKDEIRSLLNQVNASLYHFKDNDKNNIMQRVKDRLEKLLEE